MLEFKTLYRRSGTKYYYVLEGFSSICTASTLLPLSMYLGFSFVHSIVLALAFALAILLFLSAYGLHFHVSKEARAHFAVLPLINLVITVIILHIALAIL